VTLNKGDGKGPGLPSSGADHLCPECHQGHWRVLSCSKLGEHFEAQTPGNGVSERRHGVPKAGASERQ